MLYEVITSKKYPELNRMKVITFKGDPAQALSMYLVNIGIVPEKMTKEFITNSPTSFKFNEFITDYSTKKNIPLVKYEELDFFVSDQKNTEILEKIYEATFYDYLLKEINVPEESYPELFKRLCEGDRYDPDNLIILDGIIDSIGAEGLALIVNTFNKKIDDMIKDKKYPVNEKIIRITSYNVCYTKLLRIRIGIPLIKNDAHLCTAGLDKLVIKYDGTVLPCPAFKEYDLDKLHELGIETPNIYTDLDKVLVKQGSRNNPLCKEVYAFDKSIK